jgi:biotin transport system substrate-specific component
MFGNITRSRLVAYTSACVGLIALGSWISIPFYPVPLTLQTFFLLLTAVIMKRYAVIPVGLYVIFGAIGLPIFHNGLAGLGVLLGPTGGYIVGFIPAAFTAGLVFEQTSRYVHACGLAAATLVIYLFGVTWLAYSAGMTPAAAILAGIIPFIPGDIVKAIAAYGVGRRLR